MQPTCLKPECLAQHGRNEVKKQVKKEINVLREKSRPVKSIRTQIQEAINKISSLIDGDMNCICCGAKITFDNPSNAGHRFSVQSNSTLRFNLHNIHRNGVCCNMHKSGNPDGYDKGLKSIYGDKYYLFVKENLKAIYPEIKLTRDELLEVKQKAYAVRRQLLKNPQKLAPEERISLRDSINKQIGLYTFGFFDWINENNL